MNAKARKRIRRFARRYDLTPDAAAELVSMDNEANDHDSRGALQQRLRDALETPTTQKHVGLAIDVSKRQGKDTAWLEQLTASARR
jgi:hypothetical protein